MREELQLHQLKALLAVAQTKEEIKAIQEAIDNQLSGRIVETSQLRTTINEIRGKS